MQTNEHTKDRMIREAGRTRGKASTREVLGEHTRPRVSPLAPPPMEYPAAPAPTPNPPSAIRNPQLK
jgi:hypothetical protein